MTTIAELEGMIANLEADFKKLMHAAGKKPDADTGQKFHEAIKQYQQKNPGMTYSQALSIVSAKAPALAKAYAGGPLPEGVTRVPQPEYPDEGRTAVSARIDARVRAIMERRTSAGEKNVSYTSCLQELLDTDAELATAYREIFR